MTDSLYTPTEPELVAARFAMQRPGHRLVTFGDVGLPVYWLKVRALVLTPSPLPATQVFLLRTISEGLTTTEDISGFLGLERVVVEADLSELLRRDDLALAAPPGELQQALKLTPKGSATLAKEASEFPEERTLWFGIDATTGRAVTESSSYLLASKDARADGLRPLPGLTTRPECADLDQADVQRAIERATGRKQKAQTILSFLDIEERHLRFIPAIALVYKAASEEDIQVAFAVEGHISAEHEEAFAKLEGAARSGLLKELSESAQSVPALPIDLGLANLATQTVPDDQERVASEAVLSRAEEKAAEEAIRESTTEQERTDFTLRQKEARQRAKDSEAKLAAPTIRRLSVFEHAPLLKSAISTSAKRLLLISPWITSKVVDGYFLDEFRSMLDRKVRVFVGYGLEDGRNTKEPTEQDRAAIHDFERLAKKYPHFTFRKFGNIHSKILIVDSRLAVYTSFNWLSFRGDPRRPLREENGLMVTFPEKVDQFFELEHERFREERS